MLKSELAIGYLVTHHPVGEENIRSLVERNILPGTMLVPDFRIGMIIDHKGEHDDHWLIYRGEGVPTWYVTGELLRLC